MQGILKFVLKVLFTPVGLNFILVRFLYAIGTGTNSFHSKILLNIVACIIIFYIIFYRIHTYLDAIPTQKLLACIPLTFFLAVLTL